MLNFSQGQSVLYKFMGKCLVFAVLLGIVSEVSNELYIYLVSSQSYIYRTEKQFENYKQDTFILVLGDSHAISGVNPKYLENSFILSSQRENIIETYYRVRYYLEEEQLPFQLVILPVDVHTFAPIGDDQFTPHEFWRKYLDYVTIGYNRKRLSRFLKYRISGEIAYAGGVTSSIKVFKIQIGKSAGMDELVKGFRERYADFSTAAEPYKDAEEKAEAHIVGKEHFNEISERYFLDLLDLLESHGINVVLVRYPVPLEYYQAVNELMDTTAYY